MHAHLHTALVLDVLQWQKQLLLAERIGECLMAAKQQWWWMQLMVALSWWCLLHLLRRPCLFLELVLSVLLGLCFSA